MRRDKVVLYQASDGWRHRYVRTNGRTMADSGEAYRRRTDCEKAARHLWGLSHFVEQADGSFVAQRIDHG